MRISFYPAVVGLREKDSYRQMSPHRPIGSRGLGLTDQKKLLIIGASGLLGSKLIVQAGRRYSVVGTYNPFVDGKTQWRLDPLDMGSKDEVDGLFDKVRPDMVILTAAMTNVDACEKDPTTANRVNASGPSLVARACKKHGSRLVHVSTDYVFDGSKTRKYAEDDVPRPISVYGKSKLAGERAVLSTLPGAVVARPAVLYGWNPLENKDNFVTWVLKKLRTGEKATMFQDQRISPTFADDLAPGRSWSSRRGMCPGYGTSPGRTVWTGRRAAG